MHYMNYMNHMGYFMPVLVIVVVVLLLFMFFRGSKQNRAQFPSETPLDILKKRYAKGEISKEQFKDLKNEII